MFRVYKYSILAQDRVYACTCKQERGGESPRKIKGFWHILAFT